MHRQGLLNPEINAFSIYYCVDYYGQNLIYSLN